MGLRERALATLPQKPPAPRGQASWASAGQREKWAWVCLPATHVGPPVTMFPVGLSNLTFLLF